MGWLFDDAINQAVAWLLAFTVRTLNDLWRLLAESLLVIPDVTALPQVAAISARSQAIVNTGFVLAVVTAGVTVMARETLQTRYGSPSSRPGWSWPPSRRTSPPRCAGR